MKMQQLQLIDRVSHLVDPAFHNSIAIVGLPSSGKSTLAMQIEARNPNVYTVVHTDEFITKPYHTRLEYLMKALSSIAGPIIVEGTMVYELLSQRLLVPDLVIMCAADPKLRHDRRGKSTPDFDRQLNTYWSHYMEWFKGHTNIIYNVTQPLDYGMD